MTRPAAPRFAILDDLFRCPENQCGYHPDNLLWLDGVMAPAIHTLGGSQVRIASHEFAQRKIEVAAMMEAIGLSPGLASWARILEMETSQALAAAMRPHLAEIEFVIGFELPNVIFDALDHMGLTVVDLTFSPIRFLSDLCVDVRCNDAELCAHLSAVTISDEEVRREATQVIAAVRRQYLGVRAAAKLGRAGVLVGQTPVDAALVEAGRVVELADYTDRLQDWASGFETLIVKAHPYALEALELPQLDTSAQIVRTDANLYQLFAYENVQGAVGISSGSLTEAPWFNVTPTQFLTPPRQRYRVRPVERVTSAMFTAPFWQAWLAGDTPAAHPKLPSLRGQVHSDWGFTTEFPTPVFETGKRGRWGRVPWRQS